MTPLAQLVIVVCVAALTVALVSTLMAVKRAVARAEAVLELVEREIRPMAGQIEALAEELRGLSREATREMERVGVVTRRLEELSEKAVKLVGVISGLTRIGQVAGVAAGLKRGLDVFVTRLRSR